MPYKKKIIGIYKIKNLINNKVYIGSSTSILVRFSAHKNTLRKNEHFNKHLQSAYNIYGLENFSFDILEIIDETDENLIKDLIKEREEFNILLFKSNDNDFGYNSRIVCDTNLGNKFSDEIKEKFRISHLGIRQTQDSIEKIRKSLYKQVYKINNNGEIIDKYESILEASEKNNIHRQSISACCRGVLNSTGGFYWCFVGNYDENKKFKKINKSKKHINHIYENIETGEKLNRLVDVSNLTNLDKATLYQMFTGKIKNKTKFIRYD